MSADEHPSIIGDADEQATIMAAIGRVLSVKTRMSLVADPQGTYYTAKNEIWNPKTGQWIPWTVGGALEASEGES